MKHVRLLVLSCLSLASLTIAPSDARAQAPEPSRQSDPVHEAGVHFDRGVQLFNDQDYRLALVEFQRCLGLVPDFHVLYNIGQIHFQLGDYALARTTFQRYLDEGRDKIDAARRAEVNKDIESLRIRTAFVTVRSNVEGADVTIDGERVGAAPLERLLVNGGTHAIAASKGGYTTATQRVTFAGLDEKDVTLSLVPIDAPDKSELGPVWIGWGLTAVLLAGTVGSVVAWQNNSSELTTLKGQETTGVALQNQASAVDTWRAISYVLGGVTLAAGGTSLYFTLKHHSKEHEPREPQAARMQISPFGIGGEF